ncbi:hypothetical protein N0V95_009717, partial [Ascochyta clinopodiicola]
SRPSHHGFSDHEQAGQLAVHILCMVAPPDRTRTALTCMRLQCDDRQLLEQLQHSQRWLNAFQQRLYEKNVIIQDLQENFNRERSAMAHEISALKMKLALGEQKGRIMAREREKRDCKEEEDVFHDGVDGVDKLQDRLEQAEERTSKPLEADCNEAQHQALGLKLQTEQARRFVQREVERTASTNPLTVETGSWVSAHETALPSVEHAPSQEQRQRQGKPKRTKRAL